MSLCDPSMYSVDGLSIPPTVAARLVRYIQSGEEPGSFLRAVLENNLRDAVGGADAVNSKLLFVYVHYLYNEAPSLCWGSPERVRAWIRAGGLIGLQVKQAAGEPA